MYYRRSFDHISNDNLRSSSKPKNYACWQYVEIYNAYTEYSIEMTHYFNSMNDVDKTCSLLVLVILES